MGGRRVDIVQREKLKNPQFRISLIVAVVLALLALVIAVIVVSTLDLTTATTALGPGYYPLVIEYFDVSFLSLRHLQLTLR